MTAKGGSRHERLRAALSAIAQYERGLSLALLEAVARVPGASVHGITARDEIDRRVPTVAFTVAGIEPSAIAEACAARDVGVRSGHMYSPRLMRRLGTLPDGVVRASLVHYNTSEEIARFGSILEEVCSSSPRGRWLHPSRGSGHRSDRAARLKQVRRCRTQRDRR